jgi:hypothetical protein
VKLVATNVNTFRVVYGRGCITKRNYEQRNQDDAFKVTWWEDIHGGRVYWSHQAWTAQRGIRWQPSPNYPTAGLA